MRRETCYQHTKLYCIHFIYCTLFCVRKYISVCEGIDEYLKPWEKLQKWLRYSLRLTLFKICQVQYMTNVIFSHEIQSNVECVI